MEETGAFWFDFFLEGLETNITPGKISAILQNGMSDVTKTASWEDDKSQGDENEMRERRMEN